MKHVIPINEFYEDPRTSYEFNPIASTYHDNVFDYLVGIVCDVNGISEKDFKKYDQTRSYLEKYFDNNPEIIQVIDEYNDKRYQYTAEYLYDNYFRNEKVIEEE